MPYPEVVVPLMTGIVAIALALLRSNKELRVLFRNCAIVMAFPVVSGSILQSIAIGAPSLGFMEYGLAFLFFGVAASWPSLRRC